MVVRVEAKPRRPRKPKPGLRARALALLGRREYSRLQLQRLLSRDGEAEEAIGSVLDEFEARGWLSERRVVEQTTAARRRRFGAGRIAADLRAKGVSEDAIADAVAGLKPDEMDRARSVWERKYGHLPRDAAERSRQMRFLQGRGFGLDVALKVTAGGSREE